ncbi:ORFL156W [Human betaherpesvirus 5]|nr:ORFL156W [Human betaherpesvirus 5]QHX40489.1 ORFL156W [Human betaherpesvirus 5]
MERTWNKKTIAGQRLSRNRPGKRARVFRLSLWCSLSLFFFSDSLKNHRHSPMTRNQLLEHKRSQQV